MINYWSQHCM